MNKIILAILAMSVTFSSCKLNEKPVLAPVVNNAITFKHASTKVNIANDDIFVDGDQVGITMTESDNASPLTANNLYSYKTSGVFEANEHDVIKFPTSDKEYDFYAYYPFAGTSKTTTDLTISVDAQDDTNKGLFAVRAVATKQKKAVSSQIDLNFERLTSKIEFSFKRGNGVNDLSGLTNVTLNNFTSEHTVAIISGAYSEIKNEAISGTLTGTTETGLGMVYILPSKAADNLEFVFALGNQTYPYSLPQGTSFLAGKHYKYTVTLSTVEVTAKPTIAEWIVEEEKEVNAER